jgi:hypothetical protein
LRIAHYSVIHTNNDYPPTPVLAPIAVKSIGAFVAFLTNPVPPNNPSSKSSISPNDFKISLTSLSPANFLLCGGDEDAPDEAAMLKLVGGADFRLGSAGSNKVGRSPPPRPLVPLPAPDNPPPAVVLLSKKEGFGTDDPFDSEGKSDEDAAVKWI